MKRLEEELEVPLFVRTKNTIALNEYGKLAVRYAERISADVAEFQNAVRERYRSEHSITIASCAPAPLSFLPPIIERCYPGTALTTKLENSAELKSDLEKRSVKIAVSPPKKKFPTKNMSAKNAVPKICIFPYRKRIPLQRKKAYRFRI